MLPRKVYIDSPFIGGITKSISGGYLIDKAINFIKKMIINTNVFC